MKASELRIGNLVYEIINNYNEEVVKITSLSDMFIGWSPYRNTGHHNHIKPIPLTEEWLFKLGFVEGSKLYNNYKVKAGDYWNSVKFYEGEWCYNNDYSDAGCYFLTTIKYVHELQNLYFAINKTEL
jgi:hypothetical protein